MASTTSISGWATTARSLAHFQDAECQILISHYEAYLEGQTTREAAASSITGVLPLLTSSADAELLRVGKVWSVFCDAVKMLAGFAIVRERLLDLLLMISTIEITDGDEKALRYQWGGKLWTDLPGFKVMFQDYAMCELSSCFLRKLA